MSQAFTPGTSSGGTCAREKKASPSLRRCSGESERPKTERIPAAEEALYGYRTRAVFDVSQTEGKPLPSIARVQGDARHYGEKLAAFTLSLGIQLEYSAAIHPARGISEGGKTTLLPDLAPPNMPPCSRTNWRTNSCITSLGGPPRRRRSGRPKPRP
jgi:hypothetical protein